MRWRPGGSEQLRAAATLPAGVPPPGPGPGHAGRRGRCLGETKLKTDSYPAARLVSVARTGRRKDSISKEVMSFISRQEQGDDSPVTAEPLLLSVRGRQCIHEVFRSRMLKENTALCKARQRNTCGGVPGPGSLWAPPRSPPAVMHTRVAGFPVLPSRRRRSWTWLTETEGRHSPPLSRPWRRGETPTWTWLWAAAALLVWWCPGAATAGGCRVPANETCPSMYLRNLTHLEDLCTCIKVSGCLHLSLISVKDEKEKRYLQSLSFPHLLEITDYLLVVDVSGLTTLGRLFPNLSVIRGERVFHNYALVISKMRHLQEVGLFSLTAVLRGSVRVEGNPSLCFARTVDWDAITSCRLYRNVIKNNKAQCDEPCPEHCRGAKMCDRLRCWNKHRCQTLCPEGCQGRCVAGQVSSTLATSTSTITTCAATPVHEVCPSYPSSSLPPSRQCVWEASSEAGLPAEVSGGGRLLPDKLCRAGLTVTTQDAATATGRQWCGCQKGGSAHLCESPVVHSVGEAECLAHCCSLGNLTIYYTGGERIDAELQKAFRNIMEIRGYLRIQNTNITSTKILPNLRSIGCKNRDNQNFSLVVLDNPLLQDLDPWADRLTVEGEVFFQKNPRLCIGYIHRLTRRLSLSEAFVSPTNGREMLCQRETLKVTVRSSPLYGHLGVFLNPSSADLEPNATYFVSYREAPGDTNVTFTRDSCLDDLVWTVVEVALPKVLKEEPLVLLKDLSPATRYALYVSTVSTRSAIVTATTSLFNLSQPAEVSWRSLGDSSLQAWWLPPPLPPDVAVHHYLVTVLLRPTPRTPAFWNPTQVHTSPSHPSEGRPWSTTPSEDDTKETCPAPPEPRSGCCSCQPPAQEAAPPTPTTHEPFEEHLLHSISSFSVAQDEAASPLRHHDSLLHDGDVTEEDLQVYSSVLRQWQPWGAGDPQLVPVEDYCLSNGDTFDSCLRGAGVRAGERVPGRYLQHSPPAPSEDSSLVDHYETNSTSLTLHHLRHFSLYTVAVTACLKPRRCLSTASAPSSVVTASSSISASREPVYCKLCSIIPALVSAFTDPSPLADIIPEHSLQALVSNASSSVTVSWLPPASVNGMIVHYVLQCTAGQGESLERLVRPAVRREPRQRENVVLGGLEPGNYTCKVAASSLLGLGEFTAAVSFLVMSSSAPKDHGRGAWWASLVGAAALVVVGAPLLWWWRRWRWRQSPPSIPTRLKEETVNMNYRESCDATEMYREEFILSRDKLTILNKSLGVGHFALVLMGELRTEGGVRRVAVKTHSRVTLNDGIKQSLREAAVMQDIQCHHIVQLVGVVTEHYSVYIVMELMEQGNLKDYLQQNKRSITDQSLVEMAVQAADGMAYLEWRNLVHRDLAARNCLLDGSLTLKIGDFGLSRTLTSKYYKMGNGEKPLPVRWMAPESLQEGKFSSRSDVWSYGVLLWEMVTRGAQPYGTHKSKEVLLLVTERDADPGLPRRCPAALAAVMRRAWARQPADRPTFTAIASFLLQHVSPEFERKVKEVSFVHSMPTEAVSDEDDLHLQWLRNVDLSDEGVPQSPAELRRVTSFRSRGLQFPAEFRSWSPAASISSSWPRQPSQGPFTPMSASPHVLHGHTLTTVDKDTEFCRQAPSFSVQSEGFCSRHVQANCLSAEPLQAPPQDTQDFASGSCQRERGTPPCSLHSRESKVGIFKSLPKSSRSGASESSLQSAESSDSSPSVVTHSVPSLSSAPRSSFFYSSSPSEASRSTYSSSSGFQLSVSRSLMSGSTAVESSSTFLTPPSSLLVPLNTFHYTQSDVPLPHASSSELLSASPPPLRRAAAVFATLARAFPGLSDASVQASQSVRLAAGSHPAPHRSPAISSCSFLNTRASERLSLNSLTLSRLSPNLAASEPLLPSHDAPLRSSSASPASHLPATPPSDSDASLLSGQQSSLIASSSTKQQQHSAEEKYSTPASSSCRALDPFSPTPVVASRPAPSSAPPSLPLSRKTEVFSATSDLGSGRRRRRRRHTSMPEGGEER